MSHGKIIVLALVAVVAVVAVVGACDATTSHPPTSQAAVGGEAPAAHTKADAAIACPARNFEAFLKVFARDKRVQIEFTLPSVKVLDRVDVSEDSEIRVVHVAKQDYSGFNLVYSDDGYHVVDSAGEMDPNPVPVTIKPEADGSYFVSYRYGMSEGNSYRFRGQQECWYLSEDPEPPSP